MTKNVSITSGSLAIPEYIYHSGDTDTHVRLGQDANSDTLSFVVGNETMLSIRENGTQDVFEIGDGGDIDIDLNDDVFIEGSSGNVGIGVTPTNKLDVLGTGLPQVRLLYDANNAVDFKVRSGGSLEIYATNAIRLSPDSTETARILPGGNFGIMTTAPDGVLEVNLGTTGQFRLSYNDADGSAADYAYMTVADDGALTTTTVDADASEADIILSPDGSVGIATVDPAKKLHVMGDVALGDMATATSDRYLYFGTDGAVTTEYLMWDESETKFYFSDSLTADGYIDYCMFFNSTPEESALDKILKIKGKSNKSGFVELDHSTLPEGVYVKFNDGREGRDLGNFTTMLATAIQELAQENELLRKDINRLEKQITRYRRRSIN